MNAKAWRHHLDQWPGLKHTGSDIEQMWIDFEAAEARIESLEGCLRESIDNLDEGPVIGSPRWHYLKELRIRADALLTPAPGREEEKQ